MKKILLLLIFVSAVLCHSKDKNSEENTKKNVIENETMREDSKKEIYKDRMKNFIEHIKKNSNDKYIITQNGNELYFRDEKLDENFIKITDGTTQESLYYGDVLKFNVMTNKEDKNYMLSLLNPIRKTGKPVFVINYGKGIDRKGFLKLEDKKTKFVSELLPNFEATDIYNPINSFNNDNITSLKQVKNFLLLLNPEKFKDINQYFEYLKNTDFDLLIIEPSHDGVFFTKNQISELKNKKNGERRIVISYFSIGEAEDYRSYWKNDWNKKLPSWIVEENPNWKGNYIVKYWNNEWKSIVNEYQKNLDDIGVDGYLLDTVDSYYYFHEKMLKGKTIPD